MAVHSELGNGFLEKVYEKALAIELARRGVRSETQVPIPISYRGQSVGTYFADLITGDAVLCELKALDAITGVHESQLLHYLKATGLKTGLLLNFGAKSLQFKRMVR
jgi:GxxExxY protein